MTFTVKDKLSAMTQVVTTPPPTEFRSLPPNTVGSISRRNAPVIAKSIEYAVATLRAQLDVALGDEAFVHNVAEQARVTKATRKEQQRKRRLQRRADRVRTRKTKFNFIHN